MQREVHKADEIDWRELVLLVTFFQLTDNTVGGVIDRTFVEEVLRLALHLHKEAGAVGVGCLDVYANAALVGIGIGVLLRSVLDVDDLALGNELLQEQGEQAFATGQLFESSLEPVVEQDIGVDSLCFVGNVLDTGFF